MRINDVRLGRFLSVDPLTRNYSDLTPYQFAGNSPIQAVDLDGKEIYHYTLLLQDGKSPVLKYVGEQKREFASWEFFDKGKFQFSTANGDKITEKSIQVHTILEQGNWIADNPPKVTFSYFKQLNDWAAAGFPESDKLKEATVAHKRNIDFQAALVMATTPVASAEEMAGIKSNNSPKSSALNQAKAANGINQLTEAEAAGIKAAKGVNLVKVGTVEGDVMMFSSKIGTETVEGITNFAVKDGKLYLNQLHLQGSSAGNIGRGALWDMAKDLGRQYNVKEVIIQGGKRTTGKYKGTIPSPITIKVD